MGARQKKRRQQSQTPGPAPDVDLKQGMGLSVEELGPDTHAFDEARSWITRRQRAEGHDDRYYQMLQLADSFFNPSLADQQNKHYLMARNREGGIVGIHASRFDSDRNVMVQEMTFVAPEAGDRGIGPRLVEKGIDRARSLQAGSVEAVIGEENTNSLKMYRRMGFKERQRKNHSVIMAFDLGSPRQMPPP